MLASSRLNTLCLFLLTIYATAFILTLTKSIMVPFILSIFVYFILSPLLIFFEEKIKMKRTLALIATLFILGLLSLGLILIISSSVDNFIRGANQYEQRVQSAISYIEINATHLGIELEDFNIKDKVQNLQIFDIIKRIAASMLDFMTTLFLVIIFALFFLTGESVSDHKNDLIEEVKMSIGKYVRGKLIISLLTGGLSYIIFKLVSLDLAIMFALLTFLLNFIPNIGSIIAVFLPVPVLLLQFGGGFETFLVLISTMLIQMSIGNILEPKILGESMGLHPVTILLFLAFWGFIWGIPGMFLSVPITAILKIIFNKIDSTRWISNLLAGDIRTN